MYIYFSVDEYPLLAFYTTAATGLYISSTVFENQSSILPKNVVYNCKITKVINIALESRKCRRCYTCSGNNQKRSTRCVRCLKRIYNRHANI